MSSNPKVVSILRGKPLPSAATIELVETLHKTVVETLRVRLDAMFECADDLLFEFAERAGSDRDRRVFFDTMRVVRLGRRNLSTRFIQAYRDSFTGSSVPRAAAGTTDTVDLALQSDDVLELDIAVQNMASKVEHRFSSELWELGRRLRTLIDARHAPLASNAFAPATLCGAFRFAAEGLEISRDIGLVIFKLFDRLVASELGSLYQRLVDHLVAGGIEASDTGPAPQRREEHRGEAVSTPGTAPAFDDGQGAEEDDAHLDLRAPAGLAAALVGAPRLDPQTLACLLQRAESARAAELDDNARLAADLAAASNGQVVAHWSPRQSTAYVQRASLVGHMFNEFLADPHLPVTLRPQFDGLRLAAMKVALKDTAFVADPGHPVRGLINELATMASTAKIGGPAHLARVAELVQQIQAQFDVAASVLRHPLPDVELIGTDQAERFIEQQMTQTAARRQAIVKKVRRIIAEELQLRTVGTTIPDDVRPLLNSLWAPMMAMHLLHHGPDSPQWSQGMDVLDRVVAMLDPAQPLLRAPAAVAGLRAVLEPAFRAVGLTDARIADALAGLERALHAIDAAAASATAPARDAAGAAVDASAGLEPQRRSTVTSLLETLVQPGAWFLVFDPERNERRWMKAVAYYAGLDCAAFADFNGGNTLLLKSQTLLDDLLAQRSAPVDLGPSAKAALDDYLARAA